MHGQLTSRFANLVILLGSRQLNQHANFTGAVDVVSHDTGAGFKAGSYNFV